MRRLRISFVIGTLFASLLTLGSVHSATLILVDPGVGSTAPGSHADFYFPVFFFEPIDPGNPIVSLSVTLTGVGSPLKAINVNPDGVATPIRDLDLLGDEVNNDTHLLFDMSQIASVADVIETPDMFSATVNFIEGIDANSALGLPVFRSVSSEHLFTELWWTVTYEDGSTAAFGDGIIPEPATTGLVLISSLAFLCRRSRRVAP